MKSGLDLLKRYSGFFSVLVLIILLLGGNGILFTVTHRDYLAQEFHHHLTHELELVEELVREPALGNDWERVEKLLSGWSHGQEEVVGLRAVTDKGEVIFDYYRAQPAVDGMMLHGMVQQQGKILLKLSVSHDMDVVTKATRRLAGRFWTAFGMMIILFGLGIWLIIRQLSIKPLEEEILKREQAEEAMNQLLTALKISRDRLEKSQEIAHLGNWEWDLSNNALFLSEEARRLCGFSPEESSGCWKSFLEAIHPDDREKWQETISLALTDPTVELNLEHRMVSAHGEERVVHELGHVVRDEQGNPRHVLGTIQDITVRRMYEDKLFSAYGQIRNSETHIRSILDSALDAIITIDPKGVVVEFNPAAQTLFGYTMDEAMGKNIVDLIIPADYRQAHVASMARRSAEGGELRRRVEVPGLRANGKMVDLELSLTSVRMGNDLYYIGFLQDITDRKQLLTSLRDTLDVAESANRSKDEFLANMGHEIRSPMNAIMGMTELVLLTELTQEQRQNLEIVHSSSSTLLGLINDILDFSKIESGHLILESLSFDVRGQVESCGELMAIRAHRKDLEIYCDIAPNLPALMGDPLRLNQVLINLVSNAIKFTEIGEVVIRVVPTIELTGEEHRIPLRFSVIDTGVGIPSDHLSSIFEWFTQVDGSSTRKYGGTGLGLTIAKRLVEMMGGTLQVDSQEGKGSCFHFTIELPVGQRSRALSRPFLREDRKGEENPRRLGGGRLLLGEARESGRSIIGQMLSCHGAEVEGVSECSTFVRKMEACQDSTSQPDLILMDYFFCLALLEEPGVPDRLVLDSQKILLMVPTHIRMAELRLPPRLEKWELIRKPIKLFDLLKRVNGLLGHTIVASVEEQEERCDESASMAPFLRRAPAEIEEGEGAGKKEVTPSNAPSNVMPPSLQDKRLFLEEGRRHLESLERAMRDRKVSSAMKEIAWMKKAADGVGASRVKRGALRLSGKVELNHWEEAEQLFFAMQQAYESMSHMLSRDGEGG